MPSKCIASFLTHYRTSFPHATILLKMHILEDNLIYNLARQTLYLTATWGKGLVKLNKQKFPLCDCGMGNMQFMQ